MEHQKILNLLSEANDYKFVTRKCNIVNDNWKAYYNVANKISYNTEVLTSSLCNYNDDYILVRGDITVIAAGDKQVAFKNCAPFTKCITNWWNNNRWCWRFRFSHANVQSHIIQFQLF